MAEARTLQTPLMVAPAVRTREGCRLGHAIAYGAITGVVVAVLAALLMAAGKPFPVLLAFAADSIAASGIFGAYAAAVFFGESTAP